ncbi:MAG: hypothetical protein M1816_005681 [Peltula sp. TS41687]|nr:MAG: hypothetical protein M1816_005681 [Peltula sp. TS41687]
MEKLPDELITHILSFLSACDIVHIQLVSKRFLWIARDDGLWKILCFEQSPPELLRRRQEALTQDLRQATNGDAQARHHYAERGTGDQSGHDSDKAVKEIDTVGTSRRCLADWDPSYGLNRIDWYEDYIHRHAPISLGWLEQPHTRRGDGGQFLEQFLEARGMSVFTNSIDETSRNQPLVVAPLDDGGVCLWSLQNAGSRHRYGSIIGQSGPNLLGPPDDRSPWQQPRHPWSAWRYDVAASQGVSVDNTRKTAFFAVENLLTEVDLHTLQCVSRRYFPKNIAAISEGSPFSPLTVGTDHQLYLHDYRVAGTLGYSSLDSSVHCDFLWEHSPLIEPGPVSILHVPQSGSPCDVNGAVYVAGSFPSILVYDRRMWPQLSGALYSGGRLSELAHVPGLFKALSQESPRGTSGELPKSSNQESRTTLIACGEYKGRGSLELYELSSSPGHAGTWSGPPGKSSPLRTVKNRHTASRSKLLSVALHGTRIVYSDSHGFLKWVENDGSSQVRHWDLNRKRKSEPHRLFSEDDDDGDVVRKIIPTRTAVDQAEHRVNDGQLLIWTGARIGVLSFSRQPVMEGSREWRATGLSVEADQISEEQRIYSQRMRSALERQADETRFMQGLGLGLS